ncbi:putative transmembrane protein, partial [Gregarina niphandrodes]
MSELARNILLDTVLFLLMASPTVRGEDVPHSILISCLGLTIATKIVHLLGSSRVVHTAETARTWSAVRKLSTLLFALVFWDLAALYIYVPRASKRSTFYAWILFEFCGFLCSAVCSLLKLVVLCVDMSLEGDLSEAFDASPLAANVSGQSPFARSPAVSPAGGSPAVSGSPTMAVPSMAPAGGATETSTGTEPQPAAQLGGWPFKTEHYMLIDTMKELVDLFIYVGFLFVFCISNPARLPLYLATDLLQVSRSLYTRVHSFRQYRRLIEVLQDADQFPNANPTLIAERETCIICRDLLTPNSKTLPCGHVLH